MASEIGMWGNKDQKKIFFSPIIQARQGRHYKGIANMEWISELVSEWISKSSQRARQSESSYIYMFERNDRLGMRSWTLGGAPDLWSCILYTETPRLGHILSPRHCFLRAYNYFGSPPSLTIVRIKVRKLRWLK